MRNAHTPVASFEQKDKNTCDDWPITHTLVFELIFISIRASVTCLCKQNCVNAEFCPRLESKCERRRLKWKKYDPITTTKLTSSDAYAALVRHLESIIFKLLDKSCTRHFKNTNHTWKSSFKFLLLLLKVDSIIAIDLHRLASARSQQHSLYSVYAMQDPIFGLQFCFWPT